MFFRDVNGEDFIQLLGALPDSPAVTRAHLLGAFGVIVAGDDPRAWWYALEMDRGDEGAASRLAMRTLGFGACRT